MQARPLGSGARRQALPIRRPQGFGDCRGRAGHSTRLVPRAKDMGGVDAEHVALAGAAQVALDIADAIDRIGRHPAKRHRAAIARSIIAAASRGFVAKLTSLGTEAAFRRTGSSAQLFGR